MAAGRSRRCRPRHRARWCWPGRSRRRCWRCCRVHRPPAVQHERGMHPVYASMGVLGQAPFRHVRAAKAWPSTRQAVAAPSTRRAAYARPGTHLLLLVALRPGQLSCAVSSFAWLWLRAAGCHGHGAAAEGQGQRRTAGAGGAGRQRRRRRCIAAAALACGLGPCCSSPGALWLRCAGSQRLPGRHGRRRARGARAQGHVALVGRLLAAICLWRAWGASDRLVAGWRQWAWWCRRWRCAAAPLHPTRSAFIYTWQKE